MQPNIHYRVHKSPPLIFIPGEINLVYTTASSLTNTHFNIIP
jgi:hypothetical protein